jgi:hypothetical protein
MLGYNIGTINQNQVEGYGGTYYHPTSGRVDFTWFGGRYYLWKKLALMAELGY